MIDDEDYFLGGLSAKLAACGEGAGTEEEAVCRAAAEVVEALQTVQFVGRGAEEDGVAAQRIQQMAGQQQVAVGVEVGGDVVREVQRTVHMSAVALQLGRAASAFLRRRQQESTIFSLSVSYKFVSRC